MSPSSDYVTIARSLHYLEENFLCQPSLEELAAHANMSKFHFQRVFTRWAGVSPKRFLQFLTLKHAKNLLADSQSILHTAFASGLSGPARLHDLFISTEGVTPGEFKGGGRALEITYGYHPTPFGRALLGLTDRGLCHLSFLDLDDVRAEEEAFRSLQTAWPSAILTSAPSDTKEIARAIFQTRTTPPSTEPLSLLLKGTNFQMKVWNALLRIPQGTITTYGRLARALGSPNSSRAIGSAVAKNPIAYLIPCHRVIREMGAFGEYRWGKVRKKAILGWEAAHAEGLDFRLKQV